MFNIEIIFFHFTNFSMPGRFIYFLSFCQISAENKSPEKYFFFIFRFDGRQGFTSNKPTHHLLLQSVDSKKISSPHLSKCRIMTDKWFCIHYEVLSVFWRLVINTLRLLRCKPISICLVPLQGDSLSHVTFTNEENFHETVCWPPCSTAFISSRKSIDFLWFNKYVDLDVV